jgi:hypothetical protein
MRGVWKLYGFKCLGLVEVGTELPAQASLELAHVCNWRLELDPARLTSCSHAPESEDCVADVAELRDLDSQIPHRVPLVPESTQPCVSPVRSLIGALDSPGYLRDELALRVKRLHKGVDVAAIPRVYAPAGRIHVLSGHFLRSIPPFRVGRMTLGVNLPMRCSLSRDATARDYPRRVLSRSGSSMARDNGSDAAGKRRGLAPGVESVPGG